MQFHWGNIGAAAAGLATLLVALRVLVSGPDGYRAWKQRQQAERDLARERAENMRLDRHRYLYGWSSGGLETYGVALVTDPGEVAQAGDDLASGSPTDYVVLKVSESPEGNANRAWSLRQLIEREGFISRAPTAGEREALETGLQAIVAPGESPASARKPTSPNSR